MLSGGTTLARGGAVAVAADPAAPAAAGAAARAARSPPSAARPGRRAGRGRACVTVGRPAARPAGRLNRVSGGAGTGALRVYNLAQTMYLLPWAVLAVPLAVAAYPALAAARRHRRRGRATRTTLAAGRARGAAAELPRRGGAGRASPGRSAAFFLARAAAGDRPLAGGSPGSPPGCSATGCSRCCPGRSTPAATTARRRLRHRGRLGRRPVAAPCCSPPRCRSADRVLGGGRGQLASACWCSARCWSSPSAPGPVRARSPGSAGPPPASPRCRRAVGRRGAALAAGHRWRGTPDVAGALLQGMLSGVVVGGGASLRSRRRRLVAGPAPARCGGRRTDRTVGLRGGDPHDRRRGAGAGVEHGGVGTGTSALLARRPGRATATTVSVYGPAATEEQFDFTGTGAALRAGRDPGQPHAG